MIFLEEDIHFSSRHKKGPYNAEFRPSKQRLTDVLASYQGTDGRKNEFIQQLLDSLEQHNNFTYIKVKPCPKTQRCINFVVTTMLVSTKDIVFPDDSQKWDAEHCIVTAGKKIPESLYCSYWTHTSTYDVTVTNIKDVVGDAKAHGKHDSIHQLQENFSVNAYYSNCNPGNSTTDLTEVMHNMSLAFEAWEKQLRPCCCCDSEKEGQPPVLLKQTLSSLEIQCTGLEKKTPLILLVKCGCNHQQQQQARHYPIHVNEGPFRDHMIPEGMGMVRLKDVLYSYLEPGTYWSTNGEKMVKALLQEHVMFGNQALKTLLLAAIRNVKTKYKDFSMIPIHQTKVVASPELMDKLLLAENLYALRLAHRFRSNVQTTMSPLLQSIPNEIFRLIYGFVRDSYRKDVADAQRRRQEENHAPSLSLMYQGFCVDLAGCHWRFS